MPVTSAEGLPAPTPGDAVAIPADVQALTAALGPRIKPHFTSTAARDAALPSASTGRLASVNDDLFLKRAVGWYKVGQALVRQSQTTDVVLVGVSTATAVVAIDLPADAPAGQYNIESDMISRSDAAVATYVIVTVAGAIQAGGTTPTDNPANQDVCRTVRHTINHSGGALAIRLLLQINGGTSVWNRARPGTCMRVTYVGRS